MNIVLIKNKKAVNPSKTVNTKNKNGTILISPDQTDEAKESVIEHEEVHINQIKRGDLNYDDKNVYWKGKVYPRSKMKEGNPNLPWEKEAYSKTDPYEAL